MRWFGTLCGHDRQHGGAVQDVGPDQPLVVALPHVAHKIDEFFGQESATGPWRALRSVALCTFWLAWSSMSDQSLIADAVKCA